MPGILQSAKHAKPVCLWLLLVTTLAILCRRPHALLLTKRCHEGREARKHHGMHLHGLHLYSRVLECFQDCSWQQ